MHVGAYFALHKWRTDERYRMVHHLNGALRFALSFLLISAFAFPLLSCSSKTDKEVIQESIAKELDGFKNMDDTALANFVDDMDIDELSQFNVNPKDFMHSYLDGFDYFIDDIEIDSNKATATVTLSCKSFSEYESKLSDATAHLSDSDTLTQMSSSELNELFGSIIMDSLEETPVKNTQPIYIVFTKNNNTWVPSGSASYDIANALMGN